MSYPRIEINLGKLRKNAKVIVEQCGQRNIEVVGVTKGFCAEPKIVQAFIDGGVGFVADSRLENLKKLRDFTVPKLLLRLPMLSQVHDVVKYSDISLNSELKTIKKISDVALACNKVHSVILMIDTGDLREGIFNEDEIFNSVKEMMSLKGVKLIGIGTNLYCFGGVIPSKENLGKLVFLKERIEKQFNLHLDVVSGGSSTSLQLMLKDEMPSAINQLRLGTMLMLGHDEIYDQWLDNTYKDAFRLIVEIVEVKDKPSIPIGKTGKDSFGNEPTFVDRGTRKRAICAIGRQDIDIDWMKPEDKGIYILGASSDHLILDIQEGKHRYNVGDTISFTLDYVAIMYGMNSDYVKKYFV